MKKIFRYMIPCLAAALALTSCDSTMDDKADIDAKYAKATSATVSLTSASAADFQTIVAAGTVSNEAEVIEEGVQISTSADFMSDITSIPNDAVEASFTVTIAGLAELTTYYVRAYAVTRTAGTILTDPQSITTPAAPIYPLDGTWVATEWDLNDDDEWEVADQYEIEISFDAADPTIVNIANIWDGGMTVQGQYDEATGTITVPSMQVINVHASYGDVWIRGIKPDISGYTSNVTFNFTALGGKMNCTPMAAQCGAGNFGFFYLEMEHK